MNNNTEDAMDPSISSVSTQADNSYFIPDSHRYYSHNNNNNNNNMNDNESQFNGYRTNRIISNHIMYQPHSNQFIANHQRIKPHSNQFISHLAPNSIQNQFEYTTKDISCPGCGLYEIQCLEYHPDPLKNKCAYGHATKLDHQKGSKLFCTFGKKKQFGGYCHHPKCNRKHEFDGTNFNLVKCPRECGRKVCFLNNMNKCPYYHNGEIGINGQKKLAQGKSAYGYRPPSNNNNIDMMNTSMNQIDDAKTNDITKTTKALACIFRQCMNKNCQYTHPKINDKGKYYCQYGDGCREIKNKGDCFNSHGYEYKWTTDKSPKEYICQFWAKGGKGCSSEADKCWMYHPNGKKSKDY